MSSILIVGAGVFGLTAALELRQRGHAVTLLDPGPIPHPLATSTDISKAIRMDYGADEFYLALMETALERWRAWNLAFGQTLYHEDGMLFLAGSSMSPGGFEHDSFALLRERGHPVERLTPAQLRARFPALAGEQFPDGYFNPRAGWADSALVMRCLLGEARRLGVNVREAAAFGRLLETGSRVTGIVTRAGEQMPADFVVIAAGAWTPVLLPELDNLMWAVGQPVLHFRVAKPARFRPPNLPVWAVDVARTGWYGFPARSDGTFKVANHGPGQRVHPDEPRRLPPGAAEQFRAFLARTFPEAASAPLADSRLCLYCDTWDGNFWIDHHPARRGLVVCAGGSGHGFKFASVLGEITADVLERKPNPWAHRFAWRARGPLAAEDARFTEW